MLRVLRARWQQGHRTTRFPAGPPPELPARFLGRPIVDSEKCLDDCSACAEVCPTQAIEANGSVGQVHLDAGRCIFCGACQTACGTGAIRFSRDAQMAATRREDLVVADAAPWPNLEIGDSIRRVLGRSLKLRQVSAGGCGACEADTNVLNTVGWDLGRFGIQFVASPRHADGLLITGPVPENMRLALEKTYEAVPSPKIVIAVGACAVAGGPYVDHPQVQNGAASVVPVDVLVPGCPPHPLTILQALLAVVGHFSESG